MLLTPEVTSKFFLPLLYWHAVLLTNYRFPFLASEIFQTEINSLFDKFFEAPPAPVPVEETPGVTQTTLATDDVTSDDEKVIGSEANEEGEGDNADDQFSGIQKDASAEEEEVQVGSPKKEDEENTQESVDTATEEKKVEE